MDEILTFIVLWVVLYLINLVSKRLKKPDAGKKIPVPPPPVTQTSGPTILDTREPEPDYPYPTKDLPEVYESDDEYDEESEYEEAEIEPEKPEKSGEDYDSHQTLPEAIEDETQKKSLIVTKEALTLKKYIIWKEILDKPISLRQPHSIKKNRVS
jgi:hypothetical protein